MASEFPRGPLTALERRLEAIAKRAFDSLGDRKAHRVPGALKAGERQYFVAGFFFHSARYSQNILVGEVGFPAEQHRLQINDQLGHPGWVTQHQQPLCLSNTDEHTDFKQILKTSRMGSALFAPMFVKDRFVGQLIVAAQARGTLGERDLEKLGELAGEASTEFASQGGAAWFEALSEQLNAPR